LKPGLPEYEAGVLTTDHDDPEQEERVGNKETATKYGRQKNKAKEKDGKMRMRMLGRRRKIKKTESKKESAKKRESVSGRNTNFVLWDILLKNCAGRT
jgi:hypothetical protein